MLGLFAGAILAAALLLFLIQPMAAKIVLPKLGGAPSVWIASMLFFQAALLAGYFYTHVLSNRLRPQMQLAIHAALLLAAAFSLPPPVDMQPPSTSDDPVLWLLRTLAITVGLPFFVIATTSPLLQRWFSYTGHPSAKDPYFLYAASNIGNIAGLLVYPFLLEPLLGLRDQTWAFSIGFGVMVVLVLAAGFVTLRRAKDAPVDAPDASTQSGPREAVTWSRRARWTFLAFVPSSLLLGVTLHITTDIGSLPLLWSIPLLLYLLSFVLAFASKVKVRPRTLGVVFVLLMVPLAVSMSPDTPFPSWASMSIHVVTFAVAAWMCHKLLSDARPDARGLTDFYLWLSVGGVLGGIFNAIVAPRVFNFVAEYPLVLALCLFLVPRKAEAPKDPTAPAPLKKFAPLAGLFSKVMVLACGLAMLMLILGIDRHIVANQRTIAGDEVAVLRTWPGTILLAVFLLWPGPRRAALALLVLLIAGESFWGRASVLYRERTFFGVHKIVVSPQGSWRTLAHGTTIHGIQKWLPEEERRLPRGYYSPFGPVGDVFMNFFNQQRLKDVAIIGMGTGGLASYGQKGMTITFFEIDPAVMRIASNPEFFTFTFDSRATVGGIEGDGRIMLARQPEASYDLICLDAFSSDSIPVHLLTVEAVRDAYLPRLRDRGILLFHISNRYYDLSGPLARVGEELGLTVMMRDQTDTSLDATLKMGFLDGTWIVMARSPEDLSPIASKPGWGVLPSKPAQQLWTDDQANLLGALKLLRTAPAPAITPAPTPAKSKP
jgi:hypothetical protein